jgi:hypothetical protein
MFALLPVEDDAPFSAMLVLERHLVLFMSAVDALHSTLRMCNTYTYIDEFQGIVSSTAYVALVLVNDAWQHQSTHTRMHARTPATSSRVPLPLHTRNPC